MCKMGSKFEFCGRGFFLLSLSLHNIGRIVGLHDQDFIHNGNNLINHVDKYS